MTLKELKNYRSYCSELQEIKRELNGGTSEESSTWLLYRQKELEDKTKDIERFVDDITDYTIHRALKILCIEPLDENVSAPNWEKIADRIANGATGDSIRIRVSRYLKNFEKNSQNVRNVRNVRF